MLFGSSTASFRLGWIVFPGFAIQSGIPSHSVNVRTVECEWMLNNLGSRGQFLWKHFKSTLRSQTTLQPVWLGGQACASAKPKSRRKDSLSGHWCSCVRLDPLHCAAQIGTGSVTGLVFRWKNWTRVFATSSEIGPGWKFLIEIRRRLCLLARFRWQLSI